MLALFAGALLATFTCPTAACPHAACTDQSVLLQKQPKKVADMDKKELKDVVRSVVEQELDPVKSELQSVPKTKKLKDLVRSVVEQELDPVKSELQGVPKTKKLKDVVRSVVEQELDLVKSELDAFRAEQNEWHGVHMLGSDQSDKANCMSIDGAGYIYVAGSTAGDLDGETNAGNYDAFLSKFAASGTLLWTKLFGTSAVDDANAVATDASGNVYVAGRTEGDLDGETNAGGYDAFLSKFDASGTVLWTKLLGTSAVGTSAVDEAHAVATDAPGNVYVAGITAGDLDGETNTGHYDAFLSKFDASGTLLWTKLLGTSQFDFAGAVATDASGSVYVAGRTKGDLDGETSAGGWDAFLSKFDASGTVLWTKLLGGSEDDFAKSVATDASGNVYVAGRTEGDLDGETNAGGYDAFLSKFDASGTVLWTKLLGTSGADDAHAVATDASGNVYVAGWTTGDLDGETNAGSWDAFLSKFDASGTVIWTKLLGTSKSDDARTVATDASDRVYVAGHTAGSFGGGETSAGGSDVFVSKFQVDGLRL